MRELRRLLVDPARLTAAAGVALPLDAAEEHYLRRVLRLRGGDRFAVVDGRGHLWSARLQQTPGGRELQGLLEQPREAPLQVGLPPQPPITLAIAPPRRDPDVLLRMLCELGVNRVQWLRAERSQPDAGLRPSRQDALLRESMEQCERLWLPVCSEAEPALAWFSRPAGSGALLATTRQRLSRPLWRVLQERAATGSELTLAVGPEGGWSAQEETMALERGWEPVSLGEGILRSSTAAVAAAALLASWRENRA